MAASVEVAASGPKVIAIAALHARAANPAETDWAGIDALYATLEIILGVWQGATAYLAIHEKGGKERRVPLHLQQSPRSCRRA